MADLLPFVSQSAPAPVDRAVDDIRLRRAGDWEWFTAADVDALIKRVDELERRELRLVELLRQGELVAADVPASAPGADAALVFLRAASEVTR